MSTQLDHKPSPPMGEDASRHSWVIRLHNLPHWKTEAVEGMLSYTGASLHRLSKQFLQHIFFALEKGQHTAAAWGGVVERQYSKFKSNLHNSVGNLGHVIGLAELFLCPQIGGKGDSLAQVHQHGVEGAGDETINSIYFSFPPVWKLCITV